MDDKPMKNKILIVDDMKFFVDVQKDMLGEMDCEILTAESGLEALKTIKQKKPQLVLFDYNMPDLNGDKACEIIKNDPRFKDIPIVIISSEDSANVKDLCQRAGADYYMTKPIDQVEFVEAISKLLRVRRSLYYPRVPIRTEVYIRIKGEVKKYMSVDISTTGIYLETKEPLGTGDTAMLYFTVPIPKRDVKVEGRVSRVVTEGDMEKYGFFPGMAFEFMDLDLEDRKYIEDYIEEAMRMRNDDIKVPGDRIDFI